MSPKIHWPKNEEVAENGICKATTIKLATKKLISNSPEGSMRYLESVLCTQINPKHTEHPNKTEKKMSHYNFFFEWSDEVRAKREPSRVTSILNGYVAFGY